MGKVVLISCVSKKLHHKSKAKDMYISSLFKKNLQYARILNPDKIFILSAKYGLLKLSDEIEPYDVTLSNISKKVRDKKPDLKVLSKEERVIWYKKVLSQLKESTDIENDDFILLAGERYRKPLLPYLKHYNIPMFGLGIGKQLRWLSQRIKNE